MKFGFKQPSSFKGMLNLSDLGPKSMNDLDFDIHKGLYTHLIDCIYQL